MSLWIKIFVKNMWCHLNMKCIVVEKFQNEYIIIYTYRYAYIYTGGRGMSVLN